LGSSGAAEREGLAAVYHEPHLDGCPGRAHTPAQWQLHPNTRADVDQVRCALGLTGVSAEESPSIHSTPSTAQPQLLVLCTAPHTCEDVLR
jgi:hypothetical protein